MTPPRMRVVLDPCVLIAAAVSPRGSAAALLHACRRGPQLVVSPHLLWELGIVLERPKFRRYLSLEEARRFVQDVEDSALVLPDPPLEHGLTRDPGDDYLVSLAQTAGATYLVSVDHHLTDERGLWPPVVGPGWLLGRLRRMEARAKAPAYSAISRVAVRSRRAAPAPPTSSGRQRLCVRR